MNVDRLLALYDRVAEAPDAVPRLRRFVLDLAIRGKLVEQDSANEPASQLLERIAEEKNRMVKAGKIKNRWSLPDVPRDEALHEVPATWSWVRFGNIVDFSAGRTPSRNDPSLWNTGDFAWVSIADIEDGKTVKSTKETVSSKAQAKVFKSQPDAPGTMIMSFKLTIGKIARLGIPAFHNEAIISIRPHLDDLDPFLFKVIPDLARGGNTKGAIKGATLNRESISNILIPLPPLGEQRRIVAKVDELMALCDRLETARTTREATRDRLTAASLARLTAPATDADTFRTHARFALGALPALTARPDQIKAIRQTILNLAVRGKLDGNTNGSLKPVSAFRSLQNGYAFKSRWFSKDGVRLLRNANIGHGKIRWDETVFLPREREKEFERFLLKEGDIVLALDRPFIVTGTKVARVTASDVPSLLLQRVGRFIEKAAGLSDDYLFMWINSPHFNEQIDPGRSNGVPHISSKQVEAAEIFVPPLADQHSIVAKVNEVMALCDRLEASLVTGGATRRRLLEVVVTGALAPTEEGALLEATV